VRCASADRKANEAHPDQLLTLKDLLGHAPLETTLVYLRRRKKQLAMERLRALSWWSVGGFVLQPNAVEAHTGFEPALPSSIATTETTAEERLQGAYGIRTRATGERRRQARLR